MRLETSGISILKVTGGRLRTFAVQYDAEAGDGAEKKLLKAMEAAG